MFAAIIVAVFVKALRQIFLENIEGDELHGGTGLVSVSPMVELSNLPFAPIQHFRRDDLQFLILSGVSAFFKSRLYYRQLLVALESLTDIATLLDIEVIGEFHQIYGHHFLMSIILL